MGARWARPRIERGLHASQGRRYGSIQGNVEKSKEGSRQIRSEKRWIYRLGEGKTCTLRKDVRPQASKALELCRYELFLYAALHVATEKLGKGLRCRALQVCRVPLKSRVCLPAKTS